MIGRSLVLALLLCPAWAGAYVRSMASPQGGNPGPPLEWCSRSLSFATNDKGSKDVPGDGAFVAVDKSFATWSSVPCSDIRFRNLGKVSDTLVGFDRNGPNENLVVFREQSCTGVAPASDPCFQSGTCNNIYGCWSHPVDVIALTTTTFNNRTGQIVDADIELNGAGFFFTAVNSPPCSAAQPPNASCVATDVQNTVTHEAGHVLGFDHSPVPGSTMAASAKLGETSKRVLAPDDQKGLCDVYPAGIPSPDCVQTTDASANNCACGSASGSGLIWLGLLALVLAPARRRSARA